MSFDEISLEMNELCDVAGIITAATLRLHAVPETQVSAVVQFESPRGATDAVVEILQNAVPIARVEFMDEHTVKVLSHFFVMIYTYIYI